MNRSWVRPDGGRTREQLAAARRVGLERTHVPTAPIRDAFQRSGLSWGEFARRMDFVRVKPHIQRAQKLLGVTPDMGGRGPREKPREFMTVKNALKAAAALDLDPVDLGF